MKRTRPCEVIELLDSQPEEDYLWPGRGPVYDRTVYVVDDAEDQTEATAEQCLERILHIFPDADASAVRTLLLAHNYDDAVEKMAFEGYERAERLVAASSSQASNIDFSDASAGWVTMEYRASALAALELSFPYIKKAGLKSLQLRHRYAYWRCFEEVMAALMPSLARDPLSAHPPTAEHIYDGIHRAAAESALAGRQLVLKKSRPSAAYGEHDIHGITNNAVLAREISWYNDILAEKRREQDALAVYEQHERRAAREGALIECGCCFGDYAFENLVQCSEGHLFCRTCVARHTEQTLYGNGKTTLGCMDTSGSGCPGAFSDHTLRVALPAKVYAKFAEAQCRDVIKAANLDNIIACHRCNALTELPLEAGRVLQCPLCHAATCRECGEESHIPLRCEEVEKKSQTGLRVRVEEALTKARVRECPKCHQKFYKSDGCNKMTCPCGAYVCYICRANISKTKYAHFCQQPHCNHKSCGHCTLYSDSAADDQLAMRDAGLKEIESVSLEMALADSTSSQPRQTEVNIDLNNYLDAAPNKRRKKGGAQPQPAVRRIAPRP